MLGKGAVFAAMMSVGVMTAGTAALAVQPADSAPNTPGGQAAAARQGHFRQVGAAFKGVNDELRKGAPDKAALTKSAGALASLASQLPTWFPKGSGREAWARTDAKAEIWTDAAGFAAVANNLKAQTARLQQAAAGGDIDAVKAQARTVGAACKACHDKYRAERKS